MDLAAFYLWRPDVIAEVCKHKTACAPTAGGIEGSVTAATGLIGLLDLV